MSNWYVSPQIAERGTQDFSTRLIKHTELGKRVLRLLLALRIRKSEGIKALAITKTFFVLLLKHTCHIVMLTVGVLSLVTVGQI